MFKVTPKMKQFTVLIIIIKKDSYHKAPFQSYGTYRGSSYYFDYSLTSYLKSTQ